MTVPYPFNTYKLITVSKITTRFCSMRSVWSDIWIRLSTTDYTSMIMVRKWGLVAYIFVIYITWEVENKRTHCLDANIVIGDGYQSDFCLMTVLSRYRQSMVGGVKVNWRTKFLRAFWLVARTHTYKDDDFSIDSVPVHLGPFFISSLILITAIHKLILLWLCFIRN